MLNLLETAWDALAAALGVTSTKPDEGPCRERFRRTALIVVGTIVLAGVLVTVAVLSANS